MARRFTLTAARATLLCIAASLGLLCACSMANSQTVGLSPSRLSVEQRLGEGHTLVFSTMRVNLLRPFELYTFDDRVGIRSMSRGWRRLDTAPQWSPDGTRLSYVSGYQGRVYVVNGDGSDRREVAADDGLKTLVRWSPVGSLLAYLAVTDSSDDAVSRVPELCILDLRSGDVQRLAPGRVLDYVWTPDGGALVTVVRVDGTHQVETYLTDGNPVQPSVEAAYLEGAIVMALSPDATRIAYVVPARAEDIGRSADTLHISALDGSAAATLGVTWLDGLLVWSPDGTKLAFVALNVDYEYALYLVDEDGTGLRELVALNTGDDSGEIVPAMPAWSPDAAQLAIGSQVAPDRSAILAIDVDQGTVRQVVSVMGGMVYDMAWRPLPVRSRQP